VWWRIRTRARSYRGAFGWSRTRPSAGPYATLFVRETMTWCGGSATFPPTLQEATMSTLDQTKNPMPPETTQGNPGVVSGGVIYDAVQ
jgi:hypothetical protein